MFYKVTVMEDGFKDVSDYTPAEQDTMLIGLVYKLFESEQVRNKWEKWAKADYLACGYNEEDITNSFFEWCKFEAEDFLADAKEHNQASRENIIITIEN